MPGPKATARLVAFFVLTFTFFWLLWLPQVLVSQGSLQLPEAMGLLGMLAPLGPAVAAFWLTSSRSGRAGRDAERTSPSQSA